MTLQEIFNRVSQHLLAQGERSTLRENCAYRGDNGKTCAVGCLIKDEAYKPVIEGLSTEHAEVRRALRASIGRVSGKAFDLLAELQIVHDYTKPDRWPAELAEVAAKFNLKGVQP